MTDIKFVTACHCRNLRSGSPSAWELVSTSEMSGQINQISLACGEELSTMHSFIVFMQLPQINCGALLFTTKCNHRTVYLEIFKSRPSRFAFSIQGSWYKSFHRPEQSEMIQISIPALTFFFFFKIKLWLFVCHSNPFPVCRDWLAEMN